MFVKLIDGKIENAPILLRDNEKTYSNPLPETLRAFGYKPLVKTEKPVRDGYFYDLEYVDNGDEIVETWIENEIPQPEIIEEPEPEIPVEEPTISEMENVEESAVETPAEEPVVEFEPEEIPAENVQDDTETGQENVQEPENIEE